MNMSESKVEKCPKCGKPMVMGKLTGHAAFTGQATLTWVDNKKG